MAATAGLKNALSLDQEHNRNLQHKLGQRKGPPRYMGTTLSAKQNNNHQVPR